MENLIHSLKTGKEGDSPWSDQIHLHLFRIADPTFQVRAHDLLFFLSAKERERYGCLELESARLEFLWSRLFVRKIFSLYTGRKMDSLSFGRQEHGKPFLEDSSLQFNLSHSRNLVVCSVGRSVLGVDVEKMDLSPMAAQRQRLLAERFFSREELNHWQSIPREDQPLVFYRIFTKKEAYVKALGYGLSRSLTDFTVPFSTDEPFQQGGWDWFTRILEPADDCLSHVARNLNNRPYQYEFYDWDETILRNALRNSGVPATFQMDRVI